MADEWRCDEGLRAATVRALEELAGRALDGSLAGPFRIGVDSIPIRCGVYIVYDTAERCVYVGKAASPVDARRVETRILKEHLANLQKRDAFDHAYVLPVRDPTSPDALLKLEGWVSLHLRPRLTRRSPRVRRSV